MYKWHDSEYLGGAHGLAGILYVLLQVSDTLVSENILKTYLKLFHKNLKMKKKSFLILEVRDGHIRSIGLVAPKKCKLHFKEKNVFNFIN